MEVGSIHIMGAIWVFKVHQEMTRGNDRMSYVGVWEGHSGQTEQEEQKYMCI